MHWEAISAHVVCSYSHAASRCRADFDVNVGADTSVIIEAEVSTPDGSSNSMFVWFDDDDSGIFDRPWHAGANQARIYGVCICACFLPIG